MHEPGARMTSIPYVYAVPIFDHWLLRAPLADLDALVNAVSIERLRSGESDGPVELEQIRWMLANSAPPPKPKSGDITPDFLGFITTRACNIGCVYCDPGVGRVWLGHSDNTMRL